MICWIQHFIYSFKRGSLNLADMNLVHDTYLVTTYLDIEAKSDKKIVMNFFSHFIVETLLITD